MGFFRSLGQKLIGGARALGNKVLDGVQAVGSKISDIASKAAPILEAYSPALGATVSSIGRIAGAGAGIASSLRNGDLNSAGDHANSASNAYNNLPTPSGFINQVKDAGNSALKFN